MKLFAQVSAILFSNHFHSFAPFLHFCLHPSLSVDTHGEETPTNRTLYVLMLLLLHSVAKKCRSCSRIPKLVWAERERAASTLAFSISFTNEIYSKQMMVNEADNIPLALYIYAMMMMTVMMAATMLSTSFFVSRINILTKEKGLFAHNF